MDEPLNLAQILLIAFLTVLGFLALYLIILYLGGIL